MKAIALISGGLDSTLAVKLMKDLGIELVALNTVSPFCLCSRKNKDGSCHHQASKVAKELGVKLLLVDTTNEILEIIKNPKYGYGSNMNPCIDCRILLFKKAKELMQKEGASFVFTGEVLGQRPMSQKLKTMMLIEKESGLEGLVLRPLSAKVLEPTIPEKEGWIDRDKLLAINGRSRTEQFALAKEFGINDYPCPGGGCLLADPEYSLRLKDLMRHEGLNAPDARLLKIGRHFRLASRLKLVVGRDETENNQLGVFKNSDDLLFSPHNLAGPSALLRGDIEDNSVLEFCAGVVAHYCDKATDKTEIICKKNELQEYKFIVAPQVEEKVATYRIN